MDKWGLVFAGGGGKGAYEIGAWQAIKEAGIPIRAVSGSSVGALNGALFATKSFELGKKIWREQVSKDSILSPKLMNEKEVSQMVDEKIKKSKIRDKKIKKFVKMLPIGVLNAACVSIISQYFIEGYFSRDGLATMISQNNIYDCFRTTDIVCYAACHNVSKHKEEYICLNECDEKKFVKTLLASSAIPIIFPMESIDNNDEYVDGGIPICGDNVPIQPLYEYEGCNKILVINLEEKKNIVSSTLTKAVLTKQGMTGASISTAQAAVIGAKMGSIGLATIPHAAIPFISVALVTQVAKQIKKMNQYKDIKLYVNYPSKALGNLVSGTLNFEKDSIDSKIELGYKDTKLYLEKILAQEEKN